MTVTKVKRAPRRNKSSSDYISNKQILEVLIPHRIAADKLIKKGSPPPRVSEELVGMLYLIATRLATSYKFAKYPFKEDMILDATQNMIKCINNFRIIPGKNPLNPFCYFTTVAKQAFLRKIKDEKKTLAGTFAEFESHFSGNNVVYSDPCFKLEGFFNEDPFKAIPIDIVTDSEVFYTRQYMLEYLNTFEQSTKEKAKRKKQKLQEINFAEILEEI